MRCDWQTPLHKQVTRYKNVPISVHWTTKCWYQRSQKLWQGPPELKLTNKPADGTVSFYIDLVETDIIRKKIITDFHLSSLWGIIAHRSQPLFLIIRFLLRLLWSSVHSSFLVSFDHPGYCWDATNESLSRTVMLQRAQWAMSLF